MAFLLHFGFAKCSNNLIKSDKFYTSFLGIIVMALHPSQDWTQWNENQPRPNPPAIFRNTPIPPGPGEGELQMP